MTLTNSIAWLSLNSARSWGAIRGYRKVPLSYSGCSAHPDHAVMGLNSVRWWAFSSSIYLCSSSLRRESLNRSLEGLFLQYKDTKLCSLKPTKLEPDDMNWDGLSIEAAPVNGVVVPAGFLSVAQHNLRLGDASHFEVGALNLTNIVWGWGQHCAWVALALLTQCPWLDFGGPKIFIHDVDVEGILQRLWSVKSG